MVAEQFDAFRLDMRKTISKDEHNIYIEETARNQAADMKNT